jgi:hypothetical protein
MAKLFFVKIDAKKPTVELISPQKVIFNKLPKVHEQAPTGPNFRPIWSPCLK